jgi:hypothetical protein
MVDSAGGPRINGTIPKKREMHKTKIAIDMRISALLISWFKDASRPIDM